MKAPSHVPAALALSALAFAASVPPARAAEPASAASASARPELRGFWVDGFNDGYKTPEQCDALMANLRRIHCNAVFVEMRKRADAYYASHYEPWALDDPEHFDALSYLIRLAHAPGQPRIMVNAWVVTCAVGGNKSPDALPKVHPDWISLSDSASDFDSEATKIDPGNPAAADWTMRVLLDIVRHYDVDGIHLDFIRYGGSGKTVGRWGYNAANVARYNARYGTSGQPAWDDPRWQQWRRDQVTALVRRIAVSARAVRPSVDVSAATICWGAPPADDAAYESRSAAYTQVFASWRDWLREGLLDFACPMTYFNTLRHPDWWQGWMAFVKTHQYDRLSAMGVGAWINTIPQSIAQVQGTREPVAGRPAAGAVIFSYAGTDTTDKQERQYTPEFYDALAAPGVWDQDVPLPAMPWKTRPATGVLMGMAFDRFLNVQDGATIDIFSTSGTLVTKAVADGNGFWAAAGLAPGAYRVAPEGGQTSWSATVRAGRTAAVWPAIGRRVAGISALSEGEPFVIPRAIVTSGSGRSGEWCYVADKFGGYPVRIHLPAGAPPAVAGDIVAIAGTVRHTGTSAVVDATAVRFLAGIVPKMGMTAGEYALDLTGDGA